MRQKFWDYIENPTSKKKSKLTSMEQRYAEKIDKGKDVKTTPAPDPKKK